jgi:hypothetical protein
MQALKSSDTPESSLEDLTQLIVDLLSLGQTLYHQLHCLWPSS